MQQNFTVIIQSMALILQYAMWYVGDNLRHMLHIHQVTLLYQMGSQEK